MRRPVVVVAALLVLLSTGCGDDSGGGSDTAPQNASGSPAASPSRFPAVKPGQGGIEQVLEDVATGGPELALSVSELQPGENRIGFGLFGPDGEMVREREVALYVARADGTRPRGPFTARRESLAVPPAYRSEQTANDATPYVYVTSALLSRPGAHGVVAVVRRGKELLASAPVSITVGRPGAGPPRVGDRAPGITTLTPDDVGGDVSKLTTRRPPLDSLVSTDFADVIGRKPIILAFATPQLCQTRVCGPVVDILAQLQSRYGKRAAFIQQEVYIDDKPNRGVRPQLVRYRLESEPWTYVIGRDGIITARFEGAFSAAELEAAVRGVAP